MPFLSTVDSTILFLLPYKNIQLIKKTSNLLLLISHTYSQPLHGIAKFLTSFVPRLYKKVELRVANVFSAEKTNQKIINIFLDVIPKQEI
jgi:hypothetical protein